MTKPLADRNTRQKQAIREVFSRAQRPLSVDEVHHEARALSTGLSVPTVYRSIRTLLAEGWLATVELPGRPPVYETSNREHHHHFVCDGCNRVFELEGCTTVDLALPEGFVARCHDVTITGFCSECQLRPVSEPT